MNIRQAYPSLSYRKVWKMKSLNKTFKKDFRNNLSYYISITLLTMITVFLAVVAFTDADMIDHDINALIKDNKGESAQFSTAKLLSDEDIASLESKFDLIIEENMYLDAEDGDRTLRVFRPMEKVNIYEVLEGDRPSDNKDILLDRDFADSNKIKPGDEFEFGGVKFKVTGIGIRPDYIYSKKNLNDIWVDKENFAMAQITAEGYEELRDQIDWNETRYYSSVYNNEDNINDFRKTLYDDFSAYQYMSADSNERISKPSKAGDNIFAEGWVIIPLLFIITMILVSIVIGRMMENGRKYVGTLSALGYREGEISLHYSIYAVIPGILGSILGIILAYAAGKGVAMYFIVDYQMINYDYYIRPLPACICLIVPMILYGSVAYIKAKRLLKTNITSMLMERDDAKKKKRHMLEKSSMSFKKKFRIRELFAHPGRTIMVVFCLFLSSFLCMMSFAMKDTVDGFIDSGVKSMSVYEHGYYLNHIEYEKDLGGLHGINVVYERENGESDVTLIGTPDNSKYDDVSMIEGSRSEDGWYISNVISEEKDLHKGDKLTVINSVSLEKKEIDISGVVADDAQAAVYTSYDNVIGLLGIPDGSYNVVYSDEELDIDSSEIAYLSDTDSVTETLGKAMKMFESFIYGMIFMGCLLSVIAVYLVVNMIVEENKSSISMLKVLGYRNSEINGIVLSTNHILVLIGFLLSLPMGFVSANLICNVMNTMVHVVAKPGFTVISMLICAAIVLASYCVSLVLLRRKVDKVDMVVSLKGNRE